MFFGFLFILTGGLFAVSAPTGAYIGWGIMLAGLLLGLIWTALEEMIREGAGTSLSSTRLGVFPPRIDRRQSSIRKRLGRSELQNTLTVSPICCVGRYLLRRRNVCIFPLAPSRHTAVTYHWLLHMVASSSTRVTVARMGLSRFLLCRLMKPMMELIRSSATMIPTRTRTVSCSFNKTSRASPPCT